MSQTPVAVEPQSPKLLDRLRQTMRRRHYALATEEAYHNWNRRFILFHNKRHPEEMGVPEIRAFLNHLAIEGRVAASTQNQALNAILFPYSQVLEKDLGDLGLIEGAKRPERLPVVLSRDEAERLFGAMEGVPKLVAGLLYGSGPRVMEGLRLRVNSIDFERGQLLIRDGKGWKDRATVLPYKLMNGPREHLDAATAWQC